MINKKRIFIFIIIIIVVIIFSLKNILKSNDNYEQITFNELVQDGETKKDVNIEKDLGKIKIHIMGEVNNPGLIELESGSRVADAIDLANGLTSEANTLKINLAYILSDGEKIYIPNINDDDDSIGYMEFQDDVKKININTATILELENIPGIGEATANSIVEYRNKNGKFLIIEDIKKVSGIGESKFNKMKDYIVVK